MTELAESDSSWTASFCMFSSYNLGFFSAAKLKAEAEAIEHQAKLETQSMVNIDTYCYRTWQLLLTEHHRAW